MEVELKKPEKEFDMEWHPTPEGKSIPPDEGGCKCLLNRFFKDRVWKELHERVVNEDHIGKSGLWSSRDSEIFNSFPFRLLCEKVEELEDKLRGAIDFSYCQCYGNRLKFSYFKGFHLIKLNIRCF